MSDEGVSEAVLKYYILAPEIAVPERTRVLKHDDTFGVFNDFGDIDAGARHEEGLYHEGTRFLSRLTLTLVGGRPLLLSSSGRRDNLILSADFTNPDVYYSGRVVLPHGTLHIFRQKLIWQGVCYERIHVRNFEHDPQQIVLGIGFAADYADIFEIRGQQRAKRGELLDTRIGANSAELTYVGLDDVTRRTTIECNPKPRVVTKTDMQLAVRLEGRSEQVFDLTIACESGVSRKRTLSFEAALPRAERSRIEGERFKCRIETSNDQFNAWLQRSSADLNMLLSETPHGVYPFAGVPWFDTTFGRDGIITALECLWLSPNIARGVLGFLASTQATHSDAEQDAEPGKILHEARRGEMAALREHPFGRYYGSVDSTPLFVMLAGAYYQRTGDIAFIESIWSNIEAALEWMSRYGDADRDGFIEYHRRSSTGLVQQGWKDSHDSVFHEDGHLAEGPIALCEVQGYAYAARLAAAKLATVLGHQELAREQNEVAQNLRRRFNEMFWCPDLGLHALALDGEKRPCRVRSSNAGHCLFTGIAADEYVPTILKSLREDPFCSGWGIRTIADTEVRYNPMAYHNGSIWPHDNALIAAGVLPYQNKDLAAYILTAQLEASTFFDSSRLPELFCGFRRREGRAPTSYPVACSPQAWAAGAVFMLLESCLGLWIEAEKNRIIFRYPFLPRCLERVEISDLEVAGGSVDLVLYRYSGAVGLNVERRQGKVEVTMYN